MFAVSPGWCGLVWEWYANVSNFPFKHLLSVLYGTLEAMNWISDIGSLFDKMLSMATNITNLSAIALFESDHT
jgi:ABC-type sugar transport system permease subunit